MRGVFFQIKIYRKKFITSVLLVIFASAVLYCGLCASLANGWIKQRNTVAADAFSEADARVRSAVGQTDEYVLLLYSDPRMMKDVAALFNAQNHAGYLAERKRNSLSSHTQIRYFPADLKKILGGSGGMVTGVTLRSEKGVKAVYTNPITGEAELAFGMPGEMAAFEIPGFGDTLLADYPVHDPDEISRRIGEIRFWGSSESILRGARPKVGSCAIVGTRVLHGPRTLSARERRLLQQAAALPQSEGAFWDGFLNRIVYSKLASARYDYQYVSIINVYAVMRQNGATLLLLFAAFVLLDAVIIAWILHGIRYDARFLNYILRIIADVEQGDFAGAQALHYPRAGHQNEYGIIASALNNMSRILDEYIRKEYRLKLKQQETAMRVLQHQINPHFLYNTLETIRAQSLVLGDTATADSIALLGSLYRDVVRGGSTITLRDEFDLLDSYLHIMQLRYPESLSYQIELDPEMNELETVKFWMQPLAENFFSHGFDRASEYNLLIATGYKEENGWRIELIDNGGGISPDLVNKLNDTMRAGDDDTGSRIGLRNVYMRLAFFYGEGFAMEIRNNIEGGACVSIHIPEKGGVSCTPC